MSISVFLLLLVSCCGYALWRGAGPERVAAGLQLGAYATTIVLNRLFDGSSFARIALATATLDLMLLVALAILAWRSTRFWPLWLAGWQLAAIIGHITKALDPGMAASGYAIQTQFWAYPMLVATAVGAWRHQQRVTRGQMDVSWKTMLA